MIELPGEHIRRTYGLENSQYSRKEEGNTIYCGQKVACSNQIMVVNTRHRDVRGTTMPNQTMICIYIYQSSVSTVRLASAVRSPANRIRQPSHAPLRIVLPLLPMSCRILWIDVRDWLNGRFVVQLLFFQIRNARSSSVRNVAVVGKSTRTGGSIEQT